MATSPYGAELAAQNMCDTQTIIYSLNLISDRTTSNMAEYWRGRSCATAHAKYNYITRFVLDSTSLISRALSSYKSPKRVEMKAFIVICALVACASAGSEKREKRGFLSGLHSFDSLPYGGSYGGIYGSSYGYGGYSGYSAPIISHAAPIISHAAPVISHVAPAISYAAPALGYAAPALGYSAPAIGYAAPAAKVVTVNKVVNAQRVVDVPQVVKVRKVVSEPQVVSVNKVVAAPSYSLYSSGLSGLGYGSGYDALHGYGYGYGSGYSNGWW
ncbi:uncharacterized protein LOC124535931 [Vanessa cardui]|uniref:uncharacterized protein LOC124535931 n=1 Tax=Vanessa cardui TaxID=171605 RepID=UPI001F13764D|nr:uncharacterized protein LOC124535931 [Vanessa cardui]